MKNKKLICICGKAASGKDILINMISKELGIPILISHTSRPMRTNEIQGETYHFISSEEFNQLINDGKMLEHTTYTISSENRIYHYGLCKEEVDKYPYALVILNPHGINQILKTEYKNNIETILIDCDDRTRLIRYLNRDVNVNVQECIDRFQRDKKDFNDSDLQTDYIVYNDSILDKAYQQLKDVINDILGERCL